MPHVALRGATLACVGALSLLFAAVSQDASRANPPGRIYRPTIAQRSITPTARGRASRRDTAPGPQASQCPNVNYSGASGENFNAMTSGTAHDFSDGQYSSILGGATDQACDAFDTVANGNENVIGNGGNATYSFIADGQGNSITGYVSFVGSGEDNEASGGASFVGAGIEDYAAGAGSFLGAGGTAYGNIDGHTSTLGNVAAGQDSFIGAGDLNEIESSADGSFIGGGGYTYATGNSIPDDAGNEISANDSFIGAGDVNHVDGAISAVVSGSGNDIGPSVLYSTVSGGLDNTIGAPAQNSGIGGGVLNDVQGSDSFIGAGSNNKIASAASNASILGGNENAVSGEYASVLGGYGNAANGAYSIVAGGDADTAGGTLSFAAGYHAVAAHNGSFVWSDYASGSSTIKDSAANQFVVRASGGTTVYSNETASAGVTLAAGSGTWASLSDRNAKTAIARIDDDAILAKVASLPIGTWQYASERGVRHLGPMAQDFYAAFGTGTDDRHITSIDEDGVALSAIKALNGKLQRENSELRSKYLVQNGRIAALERRMDLLAAGR